MKILVINGVIGDKKNGIVSSQFSEMLPKTGEDIGVLIHSMGGSVSEGFFIHDQISMYQGNVKMILGPTVSSVAAYIAMSVPVEQRYGFKNSSFMMHEAKATYQGTEKEFRIMSDKISGTNKIMVEAFSHGLNKNIEEIKSMISSDFHIVGWEDLLSANVISDIVSLDELKNDEFIFKNNSNENSLSAIEKDFEKSSEERKQLIYAAEEIYSKNKYMEESEKLLALDFSSFGVNEEKIKDENGNEIELSTEKILTGQQPEENKIEGAEKMSLQDLMAKDSELKAEVEALVSANVRESNVNVRDILKVEGFKLSEKAVEALENGINAKEYAFDKLMLEKENHENAKGNSIFGELTSKQLPGDQDVTSANEVEGKNENKLDAKAHEESIAAVAEKVIGGK